MLSTVLASAAACAEDDMIFLEDRPLWNLDTRVFAARDGGRGALIGLGWDTDHAAKIDAAHTVFNAGEGGLDSRQTMLGVTTTALHGGWACTPIEQITPTPLWSAASHRERHGLGKNGS